jgi:serine phosphatase RsbU (regulator of sigma subunit)
MLGYALVVLLVSSVLVGVTYLGSRARAQEQSTRLMQRAMRQTKESLDGFFLPVARSAQLVRDWAEDGALSAEDPEALRTLVRPMLLQIDHLTWVEISDAEGRRVRISRAGGRWLLWDAAPGREIRAWSWPEGDDSTGPLGPAAGAPLEALAWRGRAAGMSLLAPQSGIVWEKSVDPASEWGSLAADGWYETADGRSGMVALGVKLDRISDLTRRLRVTPEALAMVLLESREDRETPWEVIGLPRDERFEDLSVRLQARGLGARELGIPVVDAGVSAALRVGGETSAPIAFQSRKVSWWVDTDLYPLGERKLLVAILIPQDDLLGDRTTLRWWIVGGAGLALLLSLLLAVWLAERAGRPIRALLEETERMQRGDFSPGPPVATQVSELLQLAHAHDEMRVALASLVKLEKDMEVARQIQQATFPSEVPRVPGYEIGALSVSADRTGGDTYDLMGVRMVGDPASDQWELCTEAPGRVHCLVADATGHGIGPALSVSQLRAMVRMAVRLHFSPEGLGRHLNEQLGADLPPARFISAWIGCLDPTAHTVRGFSAGQGPIWHYRAAEDVFEDQGTQMPPFGLFKTTPVGPERAVRLEPGDLFVVLTDGFHEASSPEGAFFEQERVQALIREHAGQGPDEIIAALRSAVEAFTHGAPPDDDRTILILKRKVSGS